jgi:dTDP-3-amino-2,3,6-trideoxy-4-keto-D-glucose/dTDP-3-amino-3,4,6-trideoxy-alpha-D-glucose/dTDP-2,6-dideoxy-D-kanosamine transaminase
MNAPKVPMNDLKRASGEDRDACIEAAARVIDSGWFALGVEVESFESEFASYLGVKNAVGTANGTEAIELALRSVGVSEGDEVVMAANAGAYGLVAASSIGAVPVFADVSEASLILDPECVRAAISPATKAVLVTHLYGNASNLSEIRELTADFGVSLVEDCAQAHGATIDGAMVGTFGDASAFSFYPTKNLGALGDGGAVVTNDPVVAERLRALRCYGWRTRYVMEDQGGRNSRLDEIQAAFLRIRLPKLEEKNRRRREIAAYYRSVAPDLQFVLGDDDCLSSSHLCVIRFADRDAVRALLAEHGVATDVHYPVLDVEQPVAKTIPHRETGIRVSRRACAEVVSVPMFPELEDHEVERVATALALIPRELR